MTNEDDDDQVVEEQGLEVLAALAEDDDDKLDELVAAAQKDDRARDLLEELLSKRVQGMNPRKPFTLPLAVPVKVGNEKTTRVRFNVPKVSVVKKLTTNPQLEQLLEIAGKLSLTTDAVLDRMEPEDCGRLIDVTNTYLQRFLPTSARG